MQLNQNHYLDKISELEAKLYSLINELPPNLRLETVEDLISSLVFTKEIIEEQNNES